MCLNHPETNPHPHPQSEEKLSFTKLIPGAEKVRNRYPRSYFYVVGFFPYIYYTTCVCGWVA